MTATYARDGQYREAYHGIRRFKFSGLGIRGKNSERKDEVNME